MSIHHDADVMGSRIPGNVIILINGFMVQTMIHHSCGRKNTGNLHKEPRNSGRVPVSVRDHSCNDRKLLQPWRDPGNDRHLHVGFGYPHDQYPRLMFPVTGLLFLLGILA